MTNVAELECKSRGCQGLGSGWGSCLEGTEFQTSKLKWSGPQHMASQMVEFVHYSFITLDSTQVVFSSLSGEILNN